MTNADTIAWSDLLSHYDKPKYMGMDDATTHSLYLRRNALHIALEVQRAYASRPRSEAYREATDMVGDAREDYKAQVMVVALDAMYWYREYRINRKSFLTQVMLENEGLGTAPAHVIVEMARESYLEDRKHISRMFLEALEMQGNVEDATLLVENYVSMVGDHLIPTLHDVVEDYSAGKGLTI